MRDRLRRNVEHKLLKKVVIYFSRLPDEIDTSDINILYCHDLAEDPAVARLGEMLPLFSAIVFVSRWQRDQFIAKFNIPYSKCTVIENAIERQFAQFEKPTDRINFIYHTTPHRGLSLLYEIFDELSMKHDDIHLDVFSSFGVYGWEQRDKPFENLFSHIDDHPQMTYHGAKSNEEVLKALESAHVFLYPCMWKETSCIALIEAMMSGCLPIYPDYGALAETGSFLRNTCIYDFDEDWGENAVRAYLHANNLIRMHKRKDKPSIQDIVAQNAPKEGAKSVHDIATFSRAWTTLIKDLIKNGRQERA